MIATAAWQTIEPEISLDAFLASEDPDRSTAELSWMPESWLKECLAAARETSQLATRS